VKYRSRWLCLTTQLATATAAALPATPPDAAAAEENRCLNISAFCREAIAEKLERLEAVK